MCSDQETRRWLRREVPACSLIDLIPTHLRSTELSSHRQGCGTESSDDHLRSFRGIVQEGLEVQPGESYAPRRQPTFPGRCSYGFCRCNSSYSELVARRPYLPIAACNHFV